MEEIWKDIKGYEGLYQVSNTGMIRSFISNGSGSRCNENGYYILSTKSKEGVYLTVGLHKDRLCKSFRVHRIVATTFLGENNLYVNHIDGNKLNNRLGNLEFVSARENVNHKYKSSKKQSKYAGISRCRSDWKATIHLNGKSIFLGLFKTEQEAHQAYLNALPKDEMKYSTI